MYMKLREMACKCAETSGLCGVNFMKCREKWVLLVREIKRTSGSEAVVREISRVRRNEMRP